MQVACANFTDFPTLTGLLTLSGCRAIPTCQCRRPDSVNYLFLLFLNFFAIFNKFGTRFVEGILRERRVQLGIMNYELGEREISPPYTSEFRKVYFKDVLPFPGFGKYVSKMFCRFRVSESTFQRCFVVSGFRKVRFKNVLPFPKRKNSPLKKII